MPPPAAARGCSTYSCAELVAKTLDPLVRRHVDAVPPAWTAITSTLSRNRRAATLMGRLLSARDTPASLENPVLVPSPMRGVVHAHPGLEVRLSSDSKGRGLYVRDDAATPICAGTTLAFVPLAAVPTAMNSPFPVVAECDGFDLTGGDDAPPVAVFTPQQSLCFQLLASRSGSSSRAFFDTLSDCSAIVGPFYGCDEKSLSTVAEKRQSLIDHVIVGRSRGMRELRRQLGESAVLWAWNVVASRATSLPEPYHQAILPVIHWVNHDNVPSAAVSGTVSSHLPHESRVARSFALMARALCADIAAVESQPIDEVVSVYDDVVELVALRDLRPGDEVTIHYFDAAPSSDGIAECELLDEAREHARQQWGFELPVASYGELMQHQAAVRTATIQVMRQREAAFVERVLRAADT